MYKKGNVQVCTVQAATDLHKTFIFLFRNMINRTHPNTFTLKKRKFIDKNKLK